MIKEWLELYKPKNNLQKNYNLTKPEYHRQIEKAFATIDLTEFIAYSLLRLNLSQFSLFRWHGSNGHFIIRSSIQ
jgi:hypothetical protein